MEGPVKKIAGGLYSAASGVAIAEGAHSLFTYTDEIHSWLIEEHSLGMAVTAGTLFILSLLNVFNIRLVSIGK